MTLDERFEQLLAGPSETLAVASVSALAESVGQAAADRLMQIAATDTRSVVQVAANEGLASIGSEQALSYLREKMKNAGRHDEACVQLADLRHQAAKLLLSQVAKAVQDEIILYRLYLSALAMSGGATAVQAIYEILGPQPDDLTLSHLRGEFAPDTAQRARDMWGRLTGDASPAWRMTAAAVLVQDSSRAMIDTVVCIGEGRIRPC